MGITHVTAIIRNPAQPERTWEGEFLVDTGAMDCLVPQQHLEAIGLAPRSERVYSLADGSEIRLGVAVGEIELIGGHCRGNYRLWPAGLRTAPGDNGP